MDSDLRLTMIDYKTNKHRAFSNVKVVGASKDEIRLSKQGWKYKYTLKRTGDVLVGKVAKYYGWRLEGYIDRYPLYDHIDLYPDDASNYLRLLFPSW